MARRRIARYEIVDEISRGGMGIVYRAVDPSLGREIAIKVLPEDLVHDAGRRDRLLHEARAASALEHPHIAVIHEVGEADGIVYLAMELIRGERLSDAIAFGRLSRERVLPLAMEIAEGLARAHAVGVIHRDLKPSNVMITEDGHAKIIDFGLAKLAQPLTGERDAPTTAAAPLTLEGTILGTAAYMAPEQARAAAVDHRVDIFAFGLTLYEMLAGRAAFTRATTVDTLQAVLAEPVPALTADGPAGSSVEFDRIIRTCTAKQAGDRYPDMQQLIVALRDVRARDEVEARTGADVSAIAVLPFADMSPARDQDYLCEGFAEELINALTHVDGLRVAARAASFQFGGAALDVAAVGRQLNVGSLLAGSVRKAGDRLRVTVQLIEVASGYHRWSQRFDRTLDDVFAIQDEIAEHVATALRGGVLTGPEKRALARPQTGPAAYECYLRGRQLLPRMTRHDLEASGELFEQAIEFDAGFAPAWAGIATVHATLYEWFGAQAADLDRADSASARALDLAPDLAEANVARGFVLSLLGRLAEAAPRFDEAIRLNPNLFDAHYYYARACFARGDITRSADLFVSASAVRQEDFQSAMLGAQALRMLGRGEEGTALAREGIRRAERMLALNDRDPRALSLGAGVLLEDGQRERALEWAGRALALYPEDPTVLVNAACLYAKLKDNDRALDLLARVFARGWGKRDWIEHDPDYDNLRGDPRFQALLANLK